MVTERGTGEPRGTPATVAIASSMARTKLLSQHLPHRPPEHQRQGRTPLEDMFHFLQPLECVSKILKFLVQVCVFVPITSPDDR